MIYLNWIHNEFGSIFWFLTSATAAGNKKAVRSHKLVSSQNSVSLILLANFGEGTAWMVKYAQNYIVPIQWIIEKIIAFERWKLSF